MDTPDRVRLQHMLDAAREAILFVRDRQRHDLATDRMLLLSLVKEIEIIGEAANQISRADPRSPATGGSPEMRQTTSSRWEPTEPKLMTSPRLKALIIAYRRRPKNPTSLRRRKKVLLEP